MAGSPQNEPRYNSKLKSKIQADFLYFIKPLEHMMFFHRHNPEVLSQIDMERVAAITKIEGSRAGAKELLDRLSIYDGWFSCLLEVLKDDEVKLPHAASRMEGAKRILDNRLQAEGHPRGDLNEENATARTEELQRELIKKDARIEKLNKKVEELTQRHAVELGQLQDKLDRSEQQRDLSQLVNVDEKDEEELREVQEELAKKKQQLITVKKTIANVEAKLRAHRDRLQAELQEMRSTTDNLQQIYRSVFGDSVEHTPTEGDNNKV